MLRKNRGWLSLLLVLAVLALSMTEACAALFVYDDVTGEIEVTPAVYVGYLIAGVLAVVSAMVTIPIIRGLYRWVAGFFARGK